MDVFNHANSSYLTLNSWKDLHPELQVGFTTRLGGISRPPFESFNMGLHVPDRKQDVIKNRAQLADRIGLPMDSWVSGEQVHGTNIAVIDQKLKGRGAFTYDDSLSGIDGLITNQKDILCTAFFADCVPLFFFDKETEYIGIAHAGWKGTVNSIGVEMIKKFELLGADPETIRVAIGPCISKNAYEVDWQVIKNLDEEQIKQAAERRNNDHYLLDLKKLNMEILLQSGVIRHNIDVTNYCTFREEELFFSHRRDHGKTGRMLGFIGFQS
ncbi:peptidoglycan editing factor PgeF [Virgibacillus phasianinus]|uniref:peptidoglycan editing factor PgeF n=1 Tax=Virgibacillus phasianinus TaxID=2017483 RepID=UPI001FE67A85|nr:peptidoglycan editing factor PgeF [Virgibacillus phasianinus]